MLHWGRSHALADIFSLIPVVLDGLTQELAVVNAAPGGSAGVASKRDAGLQPRCRATIIAPLGG